MLWPFLVLWLRTKCCDNSVTVKQGVAACTESMHVQWVAPGWIHFKTKPDKKQKTLAMLLYFDELVFPCWDWWVCPCLTDRRTPHPFCIFPSFSIFMLKKQLWLQSVCNYRQKPTIVVSKILDYDQIFLCSDYQIHNLIHNKLKSCLLGLNFDYFFVASVLMLRYKQTVFQWLDINVQHVSNHTTNVHV